MSLIVFFNRLEGFVAQVVLDFARVVERRLLADPKVMNSWLRMVWRS